MKGNKKMDYSLLRGKMKRLKVTQEDMAYRIGMAVSTLSLKLSGRYPFTQSEIDDICRVLSIGVTEIGAYFFTEEV